jgi:DNA polymerase III epsilon subunit-like protein
MECLKLSKAQQLGLNSAAELLRIDLEEFVLHRALTDSEISAKCFKKLYDKDRLEPHIQNCSEDFYKKMFFKPYIISDVNDPLIDKSAMQCKCIRCGKSAKKIDGWRFLGGQFRAIYLCRSCNVKMMANVQFKKYYDKVSTKKSVTEIDKKKPENRRSS